MSDRPHATVACVIEQDGRYLMVKEVKQGRTVYNQPAGHIENNESIQAAALRESLEETGWEVSLLGVVGVGVYHAANGISYVRVTFSAKAEQQISLTPLDDDIEAAVWLTYEELLQRQDDLRSPMVLQVIEDHRNGVHFPLALISEQR